MKHQSYRRLNIQISWPLLFLVLATLPLGCSNLKEKSVRTSPPLSWQAKTTENTVFSWLTRFDGTALVAPQPPVALSEKCDESSSLPTLELDTKTVFQPLDGFGIAVTEASAKVLKTLPESQQEAILEDLFGDSGVGLSFIRVPIGSTDFSTGHFSCNDLPPNLTTDLHLEHFDFELCMKETLSVIQQIKKIYPSLKIMASPWSAPAWMKDNGRIDQLGHLNKEYYPVYAKYLVKFLLKMDEAQIPVTHLSVVNEPIQVYVLDYASMLMSADEQSIFIRDHLGPLLLAEKRLRHIKILALDDKLGEVYFPISMLGDFKTREYVAGAAFHCYDNDYEAMKHFYKAFPDKEIHMSECSGGEWFPTFEKTFNYQLKELMLKSLNHNSRSVFLWNLALNENYGPRIGGCKDCRGLVTIYKNGKIEKTPDYYTMASVAPFLKPDSRRIKINSTHRPLASTAFLHSDQSVGMLLLNSDSAEESVNIKTDRQCFKVTVPKNSMLSLRWQL